MRIDSIGGTTNTSSAVSQHPTWTKQQTAQLKDLVNQGLSLDEIAQRLKRTAMAIKLKAAVLGLNLSAK